MVFPWAAVISSVVVIRSSSSTTYLSNLRGLGLYTNSDRSHLWGPPSPPIKGSHLNWGVEFLDIMLILTESTQNMQT